MLKKIDNYEYTSLYILTYLSSSIGLSLYTTIKYASIDSYIGVAISSLIGIFPLLIFIYLLNYKKEINIKDKINNIFGKILGTIINYILALLFLLISTTIIFNLSNFIVSQYLSETNILYIMIIIGITLYFTLNKGIETISRVSSIFIIIFIFLFILAILSIKKDIHLDNLKPVLEFGLKGPLKAGLINSLLTTIPCFSLLTVTKDTITNKTKTVKYIILGYILSSIILFLISLIANSVLGKYLINIFQYPAYISLKKASLFKFINRIENFFSVAWILSSFIAITTCLNYTKETITNKNNNILNIILIILIIFISNKIFKNNTIFDKYILNYYPYILLSILIIFILISLIILIKKSIKKV